jgi:hypothetical protein
MLLVFAAQQTGIDRRRDVNLAPPQSVGDGVRYVPIEVKTEKLRSGGFWTVTLQKAWSPDRAERFHESFVFLHLAKNLFTVIEKSTT